MSKNKFELNLAKLKTYPISKRKNKVSHKDFAKAPFKDASFSRFYSSLPSVLSANSLKNVVDAVVSARKNRKPVIMMLGSHVIKCGLNPVIIELIKEKIVTAVALNGSGAIHDFEFALIGMTSENVDTALEDGSFGMAKETALYLNGAIAEAVERDIGAGQAIGRLIEEEKLPFKELSILYNCVKEDVSSSVHIAIGTDIIHQHPSCNGAHLGEASLRDFHNFIEVVSRLGDGGVVLNIGSSVILPEVFLKAINTARNLGAKVRNFVACNFDMINQYRPYQNVVSRPIKSGGAGYTIIGQHEIMIPLLAQSIIEKI